MLCTMTDGWSRHHANSSKAAWLTCVCCVVQYQFNNRLLAVALARRPQSNYEAAHAAETEEKTAETPFPPVLYQAS